MRVAIPVNGTCYEREIEPRLDAAPIFCATNSNYTGTHVGCEHGVCGACTVLVEGRSRARLPDVRGGAGGRQKRRDGRGPH